MKVCPGTVCRTDLHCSRSRSAVDEGQLAEAAAFSDPRNVLAVHVDLTHEAEEQTD